MGNKEERNNTVSEGSTETIKQTPQVCETWTDRVCADQ